LGDGVFVKTHALAAPDGEPCQEPSWLMVMMLLHG
jgi:hypothetical protein